MFCPTCKDSVLSMTERQGIEIDYCPKCRGVWLDRGELDKIIEKSAAASEEPTSAPAQQGKPYMQPPNPVQYDSNAHHQPHYKSYKRKKSFLEELFD